MLDSHLLILFTAEHKDLEHKRAAIRILIESAHHSLVIVRTVKRKSVKVYTANLLFPTAEIIVYVSRNRALTKDVKPADSLCITVLVTCIKAKSYVFTVAVMVNEISNVTYRHEILKRESYSALVCIINKTVKARKT